MKKGVAKKSVTKKATKSVKKTNTKKLPKKKGGKRNDNRPRGVEIEPESTAHVLFTQATLTGTILTIPAKVNQCSISDRLHLTIKLSSMERTMDLSLRLNTKIALLRDLSN